MDVKKISDNGRELRLLVNGTDTAMMNAIRRTVINNVPSLAIEKVLMYENNSVMPDEMLSHRMAMVPIKAAGKVKDDEVAKFALEKEGPCHVYSGDMVCTTGNAEVGEKKIPLLQLGKNQRVKCEMDAVIGTGKMHSKWQPGVIAYYQVPKVAFENVKDPEAIVKAFPGAVEAKARKLFLTNPLDSKRVTEIRDKFPHEVKLEYDEKQFVLSVETNGGKENGEIIEDAIIALQKRNQEFKEALKSL